MGLLRVVGCQLSYERLHSTRHSNSCILHHLFNTVSFSEDSTTQDISQSSSTCGKTAMHVPPAIINQSYIFLTTSLYCRQYVMVFLDDFKMQILTPSIHLWPAKTQCCHVNSYGILCFVNISSFLFYFTLTLINIFNTN